MADLGYDVEWSGDWQKDPGDRAILEIGYSQRRALVTMDKDFGELATKAAMLGSPIIVSDGHLMAERVEKHRLGAIVPEGSVADIVTQIHNLCGQGGICNPDCHGYHEKHSSVALKNTLAKVIQRSSR